MKKASVNKTGRLKKVDVDEQKTPIKDARDRLSIRIDEALSDYQKEAKTTDFDAAAWIINEGINLMLTRKTRLARQWMQECVDDMVPRWKAHIDEVAASWKSVAADWKCLAEQWEAEATRLEKLLSEKRAVMYAANDH